MLAYFAPSIGLFKTVLRAVPFILGLSLGLSLMLLASDFSERRLVAAHAVELAEVRDGAFDLGRSYERQRQTLAQITLEKEAANARANSRAFYSARPDALDLRLRGGSF